jgi:hypothetical protein
LTSRSETTVEECVAQALEFLAHSEAEFETGDTRQGAEKLYGAACQVVMAAAKQRGWAFRSHRDNKNTATRLSDEYGDRLLSLGFTAAERFHIHFYHGDMEDYEIDAIRPDVSAYVRHMATLIEEYDKAPQHGR